MVYKGFYFRVVVRVLLTFCTGFMFLYLIDSPNLLYVKALLVILTFAQIVLLINFLNGINRKLILFFESVKTEDYNIVFKDKNTHSEFEELNLQLDLLSKHFKNVILKREEQDESFRAVIEHVGIGIFAFDSKGSIQFINSEALNLFGLMRLKNIFALDNTHKELSVFFQKLSPGQQQLLELKRGNELLQLAAKVTKYKIADEALDIVSLQNIKPELDLKETETWQKMIRILTHEIMNSVSPITSLANSLSDLLSKSDIPDEKTLTKLDKGLTTIKNRGEGMMDFVRKYRNLSILPLPQISILKVTDLMNEIIILFEEPFEKDKIQFEFNIDKKDTTLNVDREQIEQVLINLIKNSIWAVKEVKEKVISVNVFTTNNATHIEVLDSGLGIKDQVLDKIFIPFFTTRSEGSGIGLSLARQIMLMHGGSISAHSKTGEGALFVLTFSKN